MFSVLAGNELLVLGGGVIVGRSASKSLLVLFLPTRWGGKEKSEGGLAGGRLPGGRKKW